MQWMGEVWRRLTFFFRRGQFQRELREEMDEHVRMKQKDLTGDGMPPGEARNAASREFGNALLLRERSRDAWGLAWLETLVQDLRYCLRQLRRSPGFAVVVALTLAMGIGANTAIFSLIDTVMLETLPVTKPQQLVLLKWVSQKRPSMMKVQSGYENGDATGREISPSFAYPSFRTFGTQNRVFSSLFGFNPLGKANVSTDGQANLATAELVTGNYFSSL
ncbi:MAG TPA: permease prefix domain 1-containing protein, partial [Terriglobia bacterium]|nr:permease prefix domain 1-containing protein [Terriglobia bacterium]